MQKGVMVLLLIASSDCGGRVSSAGEPESEMQSGSTGGIASWAFEEPAI